MRADSLKTSNYLDPFTATLTSDLQNKLKDQLPPKRGFVPVVFNPRQQTSAAPFSCGSKQHQHPGSSGELCCEISYPNGISVKVSGMADADILRSLLQLTGQ